MKEMFVEIIKRIEKEVGIVLSEESGYPLNTFCFWGDRLVNGHKDTKLHVIAAASKDLPEYTKISNWLVKTDLLPYLKKAVSLKWKKDTERNYDWYYVTGGYIVYYGPDGLEAWYEIDGEELVYCGTYQRGEELNCASFDPHCSCPMHSWEPDLDAFDFELTKERIGGEK